MANKSIEKKSVGIDIDGDGIKDFTLDLKTIETRSTGSRA